MKKDSTGLADPGHRRPSELRGTYSKTVALVPMAAAAFASLMAFMVSRRSPGVSPIFSGVGALILAAVCFYAVCKVWIGGYRHRFFCEHCGKHIPEDVRWVCGLCDLEHKGIGQRSVFECTSVGNRDGCDTPASGYLCHHCKRVNWLEVDIAKRDARRIARPPGIIEPVHVEPSAEESRKQRRAQERAERYDNLEHDRLEAEMERAKIEADRKRTEAKTAKARADAEYQRVVDPPKPLPKKSQADRMAEQILSESLEPLKAWKKIVENDEIASLAPDEREQILKAAKEKLLNRSEFRLPVDMED